MYREGYLGVAVGAVHPVSEFISCPIKHESTTFVRTSGDVEYCLITATTTRAFIDDAAIHLG